MRYITRGIAMISALFVLDASAASAQHPQIRKGFWIGFGFGWGSYATSGTSCGTCSSLSREGSYTGYIRLGGTVSPHLLLGGESIAWSKTDGGTTITAGNVTFSGYYYPQPASGFFLTGGVGFSRTATSGSGFSTGHTGPGLTLGAGYDIRVGRMLSITPTGDWVYGHPESGFSHDFFQFSLGVTFH